MPIAPEDLAALPALRRLPLARRDRLAALMTRHDYPPGATIFLEGELSAGIWFVVEGQIKILKIAQSGRVQALCLMDRGKCFGTCPLFSHERNPATAQALTAVTLLVLPRLAATRLIPTDADLVQTLLQIYSERLVQLARLSEGLGAWSVAQRLNDCLLTYADFSAPDFPVVRLSHEKLAELAGTVREVASRHLEQLAALGLVALENQNIRLLNWQALHLPCEAAGAL